MLVFILPLYGEDSRQIVWPEEKRVLQAEIWLPTEHLVYTNRTSGNLNGEGCSMHLPGVL
jgi:hypothetical protein